jgi:glutamine amidotransferase
VSTRRVVAVPVGGANFGSVRRAFERLGQAIEFSSDPAVVRAATHVVLPGVGAAAPAIAALHARGLVDVLRRLEQPLLGICLGMQLLFEGSEEGEGEALGLLEGRARRLPPAPTWPHMGWNTLRRSVDSPLLAGIDDGEWFYFVHGYALPVGNDTLAQCESGIAFTAVAGRGNVFGCQFHPEKSAAAGRRLLANFLDL